MIILEPKFKPIGQQEEEPKPKTPPHNPQEFSSSHTYDILNKLPPNFFKDNQSSSATSGQEFRNAFLKALGQVDPMAAPPEPLPPVMKHPLNAESLAKPFQDKLYETQSIPAGLWTPALGRHKPEIMNRPPGSNVSSWEIDTPYVSR